MRKLEISKAYKIQNDRSEKDHFSVHEEGKTKGLVFGETKAKMLYAILTDDEQREEFMQMLGEYIGEQEEKVLPKDVPVKTMTYKNVKYGLMPDGKVKRFIDPVGRKAFWKEISGQMKDMIDASTFDAPDSLQVKLAKLAKPVSAAKASKTAEIDALKSGMADMQAMMAQLLSMQTAKA